MPALEKEDNALECKCKNISWWKEKKKQFNNLKSLDNRVELYNCMFKNGQRDKNKYF